jgi:hypothetical protein
VQTTPKELLGVISSIESELTFTRQLTLYFEENLRRNPATPKVIIDRLDGIRQGLMSELRYYSAETASDDSLSLLTYLDQNGFHNARVSFTFGYDSSSKKNTLTFLIDEGQRAVVDTHAMRSAFVEVMRLASQRLRRVFARLLGYFTEMDTIEQPIGRPW